MASESTATFAFLMEMCYDTVYAIIYSTAQYVQATNHDHVFISLYMFHLRIKAQMKKHTNNNKPKEIKHSSLVSLDAAQTPHNRWALMRPLIQPCY